MGPRLTGADFLLRPDTKGASGRSARGIAWNVGTNFVGYGARLASIPVLARLLTPDDYGLFTMVVAVTGLVAVVGTLGLSEAVIQARELSHAQASNLFWINVGVSALLAVLTALMGPLLAVLYGRPEVALITAVSASGFVITGLGVQHNALMLRRLMHRQAAFRQLIAALIGIAASIVAALLGAGYWALVLQLLVQYAALVVMAWVAVPWRPGLPTRGAGIRGMLSFGSGVSVFQVVNYIGRNADNVLIGVVLGAGPLGLYGRAYSLLTAPLQQIHTPVGVVIRPTLAALWPEPERYRRHYVAVVRGMAYLCMPLVVMMAVLSDSVVLTLLGEQWVGSAEVFRWLAIVGFVQTVGFTNGWLYATSGRAWAWARWGLVSRTVDVVAFVIGINWGIVGVAIAYAAAESVLTPVGIWLAGRGTPVRLRDVRGAVWRPAVLSLVAGACGLAVLLLTDFAAAWQTMVVGLFAGGLADVLLALAWPRCRRELLQMRQVLRR